MPELVKLLVTAACPGVAPTAVTSGTAETTDPVPAAGAPVVRRSTAADVGEADDSANETPSVNASLDDMPRLAPRAAAAVAEPPRAGPVPSASVASAGTASPRVRTVSMGAATAAA